MEKKPIYQSEFYPVFHTINQCIDCLNDFGIVQLVGEQCARAFGDSFVQLVMRTWEACPPVNLLDISNKPC